MLKLMRLKVKYLVLQLLLLLLLKIKTDYMTNVREIEKKIADHNQDQYIITPEFSKLTAENFASDQNKQI